MDVDFLVQDTFSLNRPQWKLVSGLQEAAQAFADAVAQNYKTHEVERGQEVDESDEDASSDDANDEEDLAVPDVEDGASTGDEIEVYQPRLRSLSAKGELTHGTEWRCWRAHRRRDGVGGRGDCRHPTRGGARP